jgi:hypothetical protein
LLGGWDAFISLVVRAVRTFPNPAMMSGGYYASHSEDKYVPSFHVIIVGRLDWARRPA